MPRRQEMVFRIGCIAALLTAALHMVGHLLGPQAPANDTERQLLDLMTSYRFALPGGASRSILEFQTGFSLVFALFLATVGGVGLVVRQRASHDPALALAVARVFALSMAVLLVISLTHFFIIPTICIALVAVCFAIASVSAPEGET
jgi:hypothetical protein